MDYYQIGQWSVSPVSTGTSTQEPLAVEDLRNHMRASDTDDPVIAAKFSAARQRIERRTLRSCFRNQFDLAFDRYPCDGSPIRLPRMPLVSVDSVTSYGTTGGATVFSPASYFVDTYSTPGRLCLNSGYVWPTATRAQLGGVIRFTAGYTSTPGNGIPDPLLESIRKLATELYENREAVNIGETVNTLPFGYDELLSEYLLPEVG